MKRADDFGRFIADRRTVAESLEVLPEVPFENLDYLKKIDEACPVAFNLYDKSDFTVDRLKIWDSVFLPVPKSVSLESRFPKDIGCMRSINGQWESIKETLNMVGRPDGVHFVRPKGEFITDMMNDDIRLLQGAHILTHRQQQFPASDDYTFGDLANVFLGFLLKLVIARKYGLTVNVHPENLDGGRDTFMTAGIVPAVSRDLRSPVMRVYNDEIHMFEDVLYILGAFGIEPPPKQAREGTEWKELNKWSCLPTLVAISGWEAVDYVTHAERTETWKGFAYTVPCGDLQDPDSLGSAISMAIEYANKVNPGHRKFPTVDEWFDSDDFRNGLSETPQLPCPRCMAVSRDAEGVVEEPFGRKPRERFNTIKDTGVPALRQWVEYVTFMRNCIEIGRKATAFASGSVSSMEKRNRAFAKRMKLAKKWASLQRRYYSKGAKGFLSEAEEINRKMKKIEEELNK